MIGFIEVHIGNKIRDGLQSVSYFVYNSDECISYFFFPEKSMHKMMSAITMMMIMEMRRPSIITVAKDPNM